MLFLIKGFLLGFSIAAPVGPIGVLCIRRTLTHGSLYGIISGLGAATADAMYGSIAAIGLSSVSALLLDYQTFLRFIGGIFLLYLGFRTSRARPAEKIVTAGGKGYLAAYGSTLLLTITNPMTILSFAAVFAGLGVVSTNESRIASVLVVFGVFTGSMLWWCILSGIVNQLHQHIDKKHLLWINRGSGLILATFGLISLGSVYQ